MKRPYVICHMVSSLDGKVTGDFLFASECVEATKIYYRINRERKQRRKTAILSCAIRQIIEL